MSEFQKLTEELLPRLAAHGIHPEEFNAIAHILVFRFEGGATVEIPMDDVVDEPDILAAIVARCSAFKT